MGDGTDIVVMFIGCGLVFAEFVLGLFLVSPGLRKSYPSLPCYFYNIMV